MPRRKGLYPKGISRRPKPVKPKTKQVMLYLDSRRERYLTDLQKKLRDKDAIRPVNANHLFLTMLEDLWIKRNPKLKHFAWTEQELSDMFNSKTHKSKWLPYDEWLGAKLGTWDGVTDEEREIMAAENLRHQEDCLTFWDRLADRDQEIRRQKKQIAWLKKLAFGAKPIARGEDCDLAEMDWSKEERYF